MLMPQLLFTPNFGKTITNIQLSLLYPTTFAVPQNSLEFLRTSPSLESPSYDRRIRSLLLFKNKVKSSILRLEKPSNLHFKKVKAHLVKKNLNQYLLTIC